MRATDIGIDFDPPRKMQIDPRTYGFDGSDAQINMLWNIEPLPVDLPGVQARIVQIQYLQLGDMKGFKLGIEADADVLSLPFLLESAVSGGRGGSSGGSNRDDSSGLIFSYVLVDGQMAMPVTMGIGSEVVRGRWEVTWNPPPGGGQASPTPVPQACLNLEGWKKILQQRPTLPPGLEGKVLTMRGTLAPNPSLFVSNLDGSDSRGLVFGNGSLSPDGAWVAYDDHDSTIWVENLQNGQKEVITHHGVTPIWSPDGKRIAYLRSVGGDYDGIAVINADGSQDRLMVQGESSTPMELVGWTPDGAGFLFETFTKGNAGTRASVSQVALDGGQISSLLTAQTEAPAPAFSPDGRRLAFIDKVVGSNADGLYIANPDGSQRRLLIQLDYWPVGYPIWSPDGKWLAFTALDADVMNLTPTDGAINVETCQVIPLTGLSGGFIQTWVKP